MQTKMKSEAAVSIAKGIWSLRGDGKWAIQGLKSLDLEPRTGGNTNYFSIKNGIVVAQPDYVNSVHSTLGESIVPVVAIEPSTNTFRCIGTGFFISCTGLLITAAHVIIDPIERNYGKMSSRGEINWNASDLVFGVMVAKNPALGGDGYIFCKIEWASFLTEQRDNPMPIKGVDLRLASDIAICKVEQFASGDAHQPLTIVQSGLIGTGMAAGRVATAIGYATMIDKVALPNGLAGATESDFNFDLYVSKGAIGERFPDNFEPKQASAPGPCFSVAATYPGGMSGSPIFDREGIYVHGVVSKGLVEIGGESSLGYGCMIAPSLGLPIKQLRDRTLAELLATGGEGIARLHLSGG